MTSEQPVSEERIELEPVTCWPLIIGAAGFVCLGVSVVGGLALWSALQPPPVPIVRDVAPPSPVAARPREAFQPSEPPVALQTERKVIVRREVVDWYSPLPKARPVVPIEKPIPSAPRDVRPASPAPKSYPLARNAREGKDVLREWLWKQSREIDLETEKGTGTGLLLAGRKLHAERSAAKSRKPPQTKVIRELLDKRDDLRGLPLLSEDACQSTAESAKLLGALSGEVRRAQSSRSRDRRTASPSSDGHAEFVLSLTLHRARRGDLRKPLMVGPLVQMFEVESLNLRLALIEALAAISGKEATRGVAGRAVFDLSPEVRGAAITALKKHPAEDVRPVLLAALEHPWAPAAVHAAYALVELNDQKAVPQLKALAGRPDPCTPFEEGGTWRVRELVRVNHLRSCLLCHAPTSPEGRDLVAGPIPTPGEPLPEFYYGAGDRTVPAVRADIVYFRQDFSAMHNVDRAHPWPAEQRFDYLVRTRELTKAEVAARPKAAKTTYPQREAVRDALVELKRLEAGK